jgi:hypothetical protein
MKTTLVNIKLHIVRIYDAKFRLISHMFMHTTVTILSLHHAGESRISAHSPLHTCNIACRVREILKLN